MLAEIDGPEAGLAELDALDGPSRGESPVGETRVLLRTRRLVQPTWALRAHLLTRAGQGQEAQNAYRRAIEPTTDPAERAYLEARSLEA